MRWAISLFQTIYFDLSELEELFDENLDVLRRARPDKLKDEITLAKETTELKILLLKKEEYRGVKGRLQSAYLINDYCRLHAFTLTLLTQKFLEKWPYWKDKDEKLITHDRIEKLNSEIIAKYPIIEKKLQELNVKGNPKLPVAMEDLFRYAMPDEMVDWRGGKPTLEHLLDKHMNARRDSQEEDTPDNGQSIL